MQLRNCCQPNDQFHVKQGITHFFLERCKSDVAIVQELIKGFRDLSNFPLLILQHVYAMRFGRTCHSLGNWSILIFESCQINSFDPSLLPTSTKTSPKSL